MKRLVLDIETNLTQTKIWVVVTKDIDTGETRLWKAAKPLQEYLKDTSLIVGHNLIAFDAYHLNRLWNLRIRLSQVFDTLVVSRLLDPSRPEGHSLESWGKTLGIGKIDYAGVWQWLNNKRQDYDGQCFDEPHEPLMDHYCVRDVEVSTRLYLKLCNDLNEKQFSQDSVDLEHKVAAIIAEQERNGFKLDVPYAVSLLTEIKGKLAVIYEQMQERWPPYEVPRVSAKTGKQLKPETITFNPGSRKQIGEKLIELGWKPKQFTETGQPIIDESVLDQIIKECDK